MININHGHSEKLLASCRRLGEYAYFVARVESHVTDGEELEDAVRLAMDECIRNGVMADVLTKFRNEVYNMFLTEYDEERHLKNTYEEGRQEGRKEEQANTKRERQRAEMAEKRAEVAEKRAREAEAELRRIKEWLGKE